MFNQIITTISIIIFSAYTLHITYKQDKAMSCVKESLDSLKSIEADKEMVRATLSVAYPQLSTFETMAYGEVFYYMCFVKYKVPFTIPAAIISVESGWNPTLVSNKKCRGIGQLSSAAAEEGCKAYDIKYREGYTEWCDIVNLGLSLDYYCKKHVSKGDSFAVRAYVGGDTWPSAKPGSERDKYIKEYAKLVANKELMVKNVFAEQRKLIYIKRGALAYAKDSLFGGE